MDGSIQLGEARDGLEREHATRGTQRGREQTGWAQRE